MPQKVDSETRALAVHLAPAVLVAFAVASSGRQGGLNTWTDSPERCACIAKAAYDLALALQAEGADRVAQS
jgi:hypothetical protein